MSRDFWLQLQPLPTGLSWRPPRGTHVRVNLVDFEIDNGHVNLFLRYSSDLVHWSSWFVMTPTRPAAGSPPAEYAVKVSLPGVAREKYDQLMREWRRTDPQWSSDEHEFCEWLATHHPAFFETEVPFIGYVQLRLEGNAGAFRLGGVKVEQSSGSGGVHSRPRGTRRATADEQWFFDLKKFVRK